MNVKPGNHSFVISQGISADISILDYCRENNSIDCICISTRGAGKFKKIFWRQHWYHITKTDMPVLAVSQIIKQRR